MKKILSLILIVTLCICLFAGCKTNINDDKKGVNVINPLPETLDIGKLEDCTVAVSLEKGDVYVDGNGKMMMKVKVYNYELYDMVDISSLKENDVIVRQKKKVKASQIERLDSGLVRINNGEENGGFDLISKDNTVYYEVGMNDVKAYYELGETILTVSENFEYIDESDPDKEPKQYFAGDLLKENSDIEYNFSPDNTAIVIENGAVIKMNKVYMP